MQSYRLPQALLRGPGHCGAVEAAANDRGHSLACDAAAQDRGLVEAEEVVQKRRRVDYADAGRKRIRLRVPKHVG